MDLMCRLREIWPGENKDWHDLSANGSTRNWDPNSVAPSPFWPNQRAPIRDLARGAAEKFIKIDLAHTWAIAGCGKDYLASVLILLSVHCRVWGAGRWEQQLDWAFDSFFTWCIENKKTSTILEFSKTELKLTSLLASMLRVLMTCIGFPRKWSHD